MDAVPPVTGLHTKGLGLRAQGRSLVLVAIVALLLWPGVSRTLPVLAQTASAPAQTAAQPFDFAARAAANVTFLQINDVYTTVPIDGLGGLARVATLKQSLAKAGRTPFMVLA